MLARHGKTQFTSACWPGEQNEGLAALQEGRHAHVSPGSAPV